MAMRGPRQQSRRRIIALPVFLTAMISLGNVWAQENPSPNDPSSDICSNLGQYIFVGGTGGFDALRDASSFEDLLETGHVGLY